MTRPGGTAVVTGAGRGIGRAVALELARHGFDVLATARSPLDDDQFRRELDALGAVTGVDKPGTIRSGLLDVRRPETIDLPDDLSVLVNNAGIERSYLPVEAIPIEEWRDVFETNVFGLVAVTKHAVPIMRERGGGTIVNVTSSSLVVSAPFYSVYRASKAAVQAMGESLRAEVAQFGIRVIEVMPGPVDTDMLALSGRLPEASAVLGYEAMARSWHEGRQSIESMITPVEDAARSIVAAVLSDETKLRWACDDLGGQLIAAWQQDPESTLGGR